MKKNKKGFTLVELLAVIVILGVLLLVAVPAVNNIMTESREKAAKDNAIMVIKAFETCNMAKEKICDSSEVTSYMESSTSVTVTVSSGNLTKFEIGDFNGYTINITPATGVTSMTTAGMKKAVQAGSFSGKIMNATAS